MYGIFNNKSFEFYGKAKKVRGIYESITPVTVIVPGYYTTEIINGKVKTTPKPNKKMDITVYPKFKKDNTNYGTDMEKLIKKFLKNKNYVKNNKIKYFRTENILSAAIKSMNKKELLEFSKGLSVYYPIDIHSVRVVDVVNMLTKDMRFIYIYGVTMKTATNFTHLPESNKIVVTYERE